MIGLSALALTATGCKDWLDINENPNYVAEVSESALLPTGIMLTAARVGYEYELVGYFWAQFAVQDKNTNQYLTVMQCNLNNQSSWFYQPWRQAYYAILPALKEIIENCEGDDTKLNYVLMAKTMTAYNYLLLNSAFDGVPMSEALQGEENLMPNYDSGEDVYTQVCELLEEVLAMDPDVAAAAEAVNPASANDMLFGGDTDNWFKFANTLYLKMLIRDFDTNKSKIQSLLANSNGFGFLDTEDAAFDHFSDAADKSNPLYESDRRQLNTTLNMMCCSDILNVLSSNDPRLSEYYEDYFGVGEITGSPYGTQSNYDAWRVKLAATDPVYFASIAEAYFLQAEAYARLNDAANAQACYEAGITASFNRWGLGASAAEFIAGDYAFQSGSVEEMVEQIINQKWASAVRTQTWDAWFDLNRTGYPKRGEVLTDYSGVLSSGYPVRFMYPYVSTDYNSNAPAVKEMNEKMWWHK